MNNENTKLLISPKNITKSESYVNLNNSKTPLLISSENNKYESCISLIYYDCILLPTIIPNYIVPCKEKYLKTDNFLSEYNNEQALMRVRKNLGIDGIALWGNIQGHLTDLHDLITYIKENSNKEIIYTWDNENSLSNMNNFIVEGIYHIKGERTRYDDNLPILNTGGGHTFSARLTVLDSSIADKNNNDDKCITLILAFNNRIGLGEVYIRTGKGISLDSLVWEKWSTLQRNVNVGEVDSLDNFIDNGIYSGVWIKSSYNAHPVTFVCVVINDYFIGISPRRISQFLYALSKFDGSVIYKTRVWDDMYNKWAEWEIINKAEINKLIKIKFDEIIEIADPNTIDSIKNLVNWINTHGDTAESIINSIQGLEDGLTSLTSDIGMVNDTISLIKTTAAKVDGNVFNSTADEVKLTTTGVDINKHYTVILPAATVEKAGAMSASDKINLDNVPKKIDEAVVQEKQRAQQIENAIAKNGIKFEQTGIVVENGKLIFKKSSIDDSLNDLYVFPNVTTEHDGLMSTNDKIDLDANKSNIAIIDKALKNELTRRLEVETDFYNTAVRYDKVGFIQYTNSLELYTRNLNDSETFYIDLPAATNKKAGVMTAEDKFKLDKLASKTVYLTETEYKNLIETGEILDDVEYNIYE